MQSSLVVVDSTDSHERLLAEAGQIAAGTGTPLVLLTRITEEEIAENAETLQAMSEAANTPLNSDSAREVADRFAEEAADEAFAGLDGTVEYDVVSVVAEEDELADEVVRVAGERGCDHVYVAGRQRSPTGKALFGDTAQRLVLNFDGPVTVLTG
ncbi:universal stress protein [Halogeometricum sp. S1BR25-6]|uniref:Universal stress protein n=1 Tax=Halogeometricum salsisoli TaxID=2950536 RepID=A0ABU2GK89_9EURY|nr:universal stress protein [Halogeometricum sp. S1BR25-6]MDS0300609.1 universal stress protein [Halogeometricum sp. S1BR25-6]